MKATGYTRETIRYAGLKELNYPKFEVGDAVEVSLKIKEGDKFRIQKFEGDVIAIRMKGASSTFMVRRIGADSVSVERIFPYYSPTIDSVKLLRKGRCRRAKLFYMRERIGKAARVKERVLTRAEREVALAQ